MARYEIRTRITFRGIKYGIKNTSSKEWFVKPIYDKISFESYSEIFFKDKYFDILYFIIQKGKSYDVFKNKYGFAYPKNNYFLEPISEYPIALRKGLDYFQIKVDGKCGLMKISGEWILKPIYDFLGHSDSMGYIDAGLNGYEGFINLDGSWIIKPEFEQLERFSSLGLREDSKVCFAKKYSKWGFINRTGDWVVQPKYDEIGHFDENDFCIVKINNKIGIVDFEGNELFEPIYDKLDYNKEFLHGLQIDRNIFNNEGNAHAELNGKKVILNKKGNVEGVY
jgi:hypothetical protein